MLNGRRLRVAWHHLPELGMKVGYVVLYVNDAEACRRFWVDQIGMVEKRRTEAGLFTIAQVGFADQPFGLDLATPSIAFAVDDLDATRTGLVGRGVQASEIGEHGGTQSFAFADPEGR